MAWMPPAVMVSQCMNYKFKHGLFLKENERSATFNKFFFLAFWRLMDVCQTNTCHYEEKWWSNSFT